MTEAEKLELVEKLRRARAEYALLLHFDNRRRQIGHDYGAGQRWNELTRRERELDSLDRFAQVVLGESHEEANVPPTHEELVAAFAKIGRPRLRRLRNEGFRRHTPSTRRTEATWASLEGFYGREIS